MDYAKPNTKGGRIIEFTELIAKTIISAMVSISLYLRKLDVIIQSQFQNTICVNGLSNVAEVVG